MTPLRVALVAFAVAFSGATAASAATYEVTKRGDPGPGACTPADCSLREAVQAADESLGEADRIVLPSRARYRLSIPDANDGVLSGDLDVNNDPLLIIHPGRGRAIVVTDVEDRVLDVAAGAPTRLVKLEITGGDEPSDGGAGGGIRSLADLKLVRSVVTENRANTCGGGIHTEASAALVLRRSRVTLNESAGDGGGISHSCAPGGAGKLTIENSTIARNRSDADNSFTGRGGGAFLGWDGPLESSISNSTFSGNSTGPGGLGQSQGGGMFVNGGALTITRSTIGGNRSGDNGGGLFVMNTGPLRLVNATVARNRANDNGGGIDAANGAISLNAVTVARNLGNADGMLSEAGGGLSNDSADFRVENSLIALNRIGDLGGGDPIRNDCSGATPFHSAGHNLLSSRFLCDGFDAPGDLRRNRVRIGDLADNGGGTKTIALLRRSPAINAAKRATAPRRDQRGRKRGRKPDIGAYERTG